MKSLITRKSRNLSAREFQGLAEVPPELEWFGNITNEQTRRAYKNDVTEFSGFVGIGAPEEMRLVARVHSIAWRKELEGCERSPSTMRRNLSAISSSFDYLCEKTRSRLTR